MGRELISSEKRLRGKVGAETEGKIKSGVEAGELGLPPSLRVLLHIYNEKQRSGGGGGSGGGHVFAPWHTLD